MVVSLFTTKISDSLQFKHSRYREVYVLKLNEITYNLRQRSQFHIPLARAAFSGTESIEYLGPKIWKLIPDEMKELEIIWEFKRAIKQWKPTSCPCRL